MAENSGSLGRNSVECLDTLQKFISDLDALMEQNPRELSPFEVLLSRYFPLKNCDVEEAISICKKSKFLIHVSEYRQNFVFEFSNAGGAVSALSGFDVIFGISKSTGDSQLPFAKVHKG